MNNITKDAAESKREQEELLSKLTEKVMAKQGHVVGEGDLSRADFDVSVSVGPSSSSKRAATVRAVTGMMSITQDPETRTVLGAMALENMEGEGISEVREWNRKKLVAMGVYEPNDEDKKAEAAAAENAQPSPQDAYLIAEADKSKAQAANYAADAAKTEAETALTYAKIDGETADTAKALSDIEASQRSELLGMAKELDDSNEIQRQKTAQPLNGASNGLPPGL